MICKYSQIQLILSVHYISYGQILIKSETYEVWTRQAAGYASGLQYCRGLPFLDYKMFYASCRDLGYIFHVKEESNKGFLVVAWCTLPKGSHCPLCTLGGCSRQLCVMFSFSCIYHFTPRCIPYWVAAVVFVVIYIIIIISIVFFDLFCYCYVAQVASRQP